MLTLRNPTMEIEEIIRICVTQVVLTNACVGFGGPSPIFTGAFSTRFRIGGLLFCNCEEYGE